MMEQATGYSFYIKPIHDLLLRGTPQTPAGLYQLQLLTAEQLTRLHYRPGMLTTVKARLKTLTTYGYVQSDVIPSRKWRTPYYYTLGSAGVKYLASVGCDASWRPGSAAYHALFVEHTLELNDVLISALQLQGVSQYRLASFTHEHVLKRTPYKAHGVTLIPDAFLEFRQGSRKLPILLEHDRGTEEQQYFRKRIRAYLAFLRARGYEQLFGTTTASVVFTTFVGEARVEQMQKWAAMEVGNDPLGQAFCFTNLRPPLDPSIWLSPTWQTLHGGSESLFAA